MLIVVPLAVSAIVGAGYVACGWRRWTAWWGPVAAVTVLCSGLAVIGKTGTSHVAGVFRADTTSGYLLVIIGAVGGLALLALSPQLHTAVQQCRIGELRARCYAAAATLYLLGTSIAVVAANALVTCVALQLSLILMSISIAAQRKATARKIAICCLLLGTAAIAILGTVWLWANGGSHEAGPSGRYFSATIVVGMSAYAGLLPPHGWRISGTARLPGPIAAVMSSGSLVVAMSVLRQLPTDSGDVAQLCLALIGTGCVVTALLGLWTQRDYVRMIGYSVIAQCGTLWILASETDVAKLGALLPHVLVICLIAMVLYIASGALQAMAGSRRIAAVSGLPQRSRLLAVSFGSALLLAVVSPLVILVHLVSGLSDGSRPIWWQHELSAIITVTLLFVALVAIALKLVSNGVQLLFRKAHSSAELVIGSGPPLGMARVAMPTGVLATVLVYVIDIPSSLTAITAS